MELSKTGDCRPEETSASRNAGFVPFRLRLPFNHQQGPRRHEPRARSTTKKAIKSSFFIKNYGGETGTTPYAFAHGRAIALSSTNDKGWHDGMSWVHRGSSSDGDHTTRAAPSPLDHERTASIHCAATRENTECATRASRATANADGHHDASARRHRKPTKHCCQS